MANAMKARMNALMAQEIERNPNILLGKKTIGYALIVWLASRLIFHAADFACVAQGFWKLSTTNLIGLVAGVVFALSAYAGAKLFAILPMIGGFMLLYVPADRQQNVLKLFEESKIIPFEFEEDGTKLIYGGGK